MRIKVNQLGLYGLGVETIPVILVLRQTCVSPLLFISKFSKMKKNKEFTNEVKRSPETYKEAVTRAIVSTVLNGVSKNSHVYTEVEQLSILYESLTELKKTP